MGAKGAHADGGSRVDEHQIKVHSVHRIFRAIIFDFFFFLLVKKFVEKKNWWSRAGGVTTPPPLDPRLNSAWKISLSAKT